jgi:hypothetical protein
MSTNDPLQDPNINPAKLSGTRITMPDFEIICPKCGVDISLELGRTDHVYVLTNDGCVRCSRCGGVAVNPSRNGQPWTGVNNNPANIRLANDVAAMMRKLTGG